MASDLNQDQQDGGSAGAARWRVTIVRMDAKVRGAVLIRYPAIRSMDLSDLPAVVRTTGDLEVARQTAQGLRSMGAVVILSVEPAVRQGSAYCSWHRSRLAMHSCIRCDKPICRLCVDRSDGEAYCEECTEVTLSPRRRTRLRQLFMLFLFSVFVYFVVDHLQSEQAGIDPNGTVRVGILQFVPPEHVGAEVLRTMNGVEGASGEGNSLYDIAPWYNRERVRHGGMSIPYMQADILGPWAEDMSPPELATAGDGLTQGLYRSWSYSRFFVSMAERLGVDLDDYGVRVFLVYESGSRDLAAHSRGSEKGHLAVPYVHVNETNPAYGVVTVAHEIAHALGAEDSYDLESGLAIFPAGFVDPFGEGLYPQQSAELMSPDIPVAPRREREVTSLFQVKIGYETAAQLRWITPEEADAYYEGPKWDAQRGVPGRELQTSESRTTGGVPSD